MEQYELQKLRDLPIEGVAERLGLRVSRHKSLCPFHEDHHASLSFNLRKNNCRCFVCMNESIGTIDLVMKKLRLGFREACKWLADDSNIILTEYKAPPLNGEVGRGLSFDASRYERFFDRPWLSDKAKEFLFKERQLDERVIRWCRLNSYKDWLQIPYFSHQGLLTGFQQRYLGSDPEQPRFRFGYGERVGIYNLPVLKLLKPGEDLWITEGCSDCWSMLSSGHKAIAIPSATLLKPSDIKLLSTLSSKLSTKFHMYPDNDLPGEQLFLKLKEMLPNLVREFLPPGCKDYSDYYLLKRKEAHV